MTVFFNELTKEEKDEKGEVIKPAKEIALDFKCESYTLDLGWISLTLKDRIIHIPATRVKEVQAKRDATG